jgi:hypothetical protein
MVLEKRSKIISYMRISAGESLRTNLGIVGRSTIMG